jgi:hypothetical protein
MKLANINCLIIFSNGSTQYSYNNKINKTQLLFYYKDIVNLYIKKTNKIKNKSEFFKTYKKVY